MQPQEVARVPLPTPAGEFDVRAFECASGFVYLAMVRGDVRDARSVLTRVHSECLTGDALGSLRCDCGVQLRLALRAIAAEGRGVLLYVTGHEGRGIGLVNKLRAYMLQDRGEDTVDANHALGLPVDARDYRDAAACLGALGVRSVRLLTNNPRKMTALREAGVDVEGIVPIPVAPSARTVRYLDTKRRRMGHVAPMGDAPDARVGDVHDVSSLMGAVRDRGWRPYVVVKYAQTIDGRIATSTGDSKWISGEDERRVSHALRAASDAVVVGIGTVLADDPSLTVRMVPGPSPIRVVLDSSLRTPPTAAVLDAEAATAIVTTAASEPARRRALAERGVAVHVVPKGDGGVDARAALGALRREGIRSVLVEGGAAVITSLLAAGLVDRVIVSIAPRILGAGTEAVGDLGVRHVTDGLALEHRTVHTAGEDVLIAADVRAAATPPLRLASDATPA